MAMVSNLPVDGDVGLVIKGAWTWRSLTPAAPISSPAAKPSPTRTGRGHMRKQDKSPCAEWLRPLYRSRLQHRQLRAVLPWHVHANQPCSGSVQLHATRDGILRANRIGRQA